MLGLVSGAALADISVTGNFAYRYDSVGAPKVASVNKDRIAAEVTLSSQVNDSTKAVIGLATGSANSRFATLGDNNSLKNFDLSLAYVEYAPLANAKITIGKQYQPWVRGSSYFIDKDIHPEGVSVAYNAGHGINATAYSLTTAEGLTGPDSKVKGIQVGLSQDVAGLKAGLAAGIQNHDFTVGLVRSKYDLKTLSASVGKEVAGRPVTVFYDYAKNGRVSTFNKATAYGVVFGQAKNPGNFDIALLHQKVEKSALPVAWMDNDFAMNAVQNDGDAIVVNYVVAKGWKVTGNYYDAKAGVTNTPNRHIMVDLKYMF